MRLGVLAAVSTSDQGSLDHFITELIRAGFEPVPGSECHEWEGPIDPAFGALTTARTMRIRLRDGWPFRHPHLLVRGIVSEHVNAEGVVCLWAEDDNSRTWLTLAALKVRMAEWCAAASEGFGPTALALDAHLGFARQGLPLAVLDLQALGSIAAHDGDCARIHGVLSHPKLIKIGPGDGPEGAHPGRCYRRHGRMPPPLTLDGFKEFLTAGQKRNLERGLERLVAGTEGGIHLAVLLFMRSDHLDALVLHFTAETRGVVTSQALPAAPTDLDILLTRAGPDAGLLRHRKAVCLGVGAVGSHVVSLLAQSGFGALGLVDSDILRPGNVTRHLGGHADVGYPKTEVMQRWIQDHAPWTSVEAYDAVWRTDLLIDLAESADILVDTTGNGPLLERLSRIAERV